MQEAQALRRQVMVKDKEAAERATLVKQEKLQRHANRPPLRLIDVWCFPTISQKRKTPGTLECHYNGFRCAPGGGAVGPVRPDAATCQPSPTPCSTCRDRHTIPRPVAGGSC